MAVKNTPTIRTIISGDELSQKDISETFTLSEKIEVQYILDSLDSAETLNFDFVDIVKSIVFNSTGTYTITITMLDSNVIPFEVTGVFKLNPTASFRALIDTIAISTTSTTSTTINVSIYGEAA